MLNQRLADGVLHLELNRPEVGNALGPALVEALIQAIGEASADAAVHTVFLQGAGRHFCTGLDLSELATLSDGDLLLRLVRIETLLGMLWHAPLRTVVLARGRTWGAGADLLAVCEQRFAAPGSSFRFPGAQFGIVLGTRRLSERIGPDAARRLVLEGGELDAPQALAAGLVSQVAEAVHLADLRVAAGTARAIRAATRADLRDADLAALVRSAAEPGLQARITAYRARLLATKPPV
jgi:enoyl-CoA hydratase